MSVLRRAAERYALEFGWRVFPCAPQGKHPITRHGHLDATTDAAMIARWWTATPTANIGVACAASELVALDIDPRHGGDTELDALTAEHGELPETPLALTGGGGMHYLFAAPMGLGWRAQVRPGVEVKSRGYVVVAPSLHPSGTAYAWEHSAHPRDVPVAPPPGWLVRLGALLAREAHAPPRGELARTLLARAFHHAGMVRRQVDAVRLAVVCPWTEEHSTGGGSATSTVVFAPRDRGGRGWFHCSHASCSGRRTLGGVLEALHQLAPDALRAAAIEVGTSRIDDDVAERAAIATEGA